MVLLLFNKNAFVGGPHEGHISNTGSEFSQAVLPHQAADLVLGDGVERFTDMEPAAGHQLAGQVFHHLRAQAGRQVVDDEMDKDHVVRLVGNGQL
jgi:hypothetical protein